MLDFYKKILSAKDLSEISFNNLPVDDIANCFFILLSNSNIDKEAICSKVKIPSGSLVLDTLCAHPKFVKKYFHKHTIENFLELTEIKYPNLSFKPIITNTLDTTIFELKDLNNSEIMIGAMTITGPILHYVQDRLDGRTKIDIFNSFSSDNEDSIRDITNLCSIYSAGNITNIAINHFLFMSTAYLYVLVDGEPVVILANMKFYETLADFIIRKVQNHKN